MKIKLLLTNCYVRWRTLLLFVKTLWTFLTILTSGKTNDDYSNTQ